MDTLHELLLKKEQLLKNKESARVRCNMPEMQYYAALIEQVDQAVRSLLPTKEK